MRGALILEQLKPVGRVLEGRACFLEVERVAQRQALLAAFTLLDLNGNKRLSKQEFEKLMKAVRPRVSASTVELTFSLLDADKNDTIDQGAPR